MMSVIDAPLDASSARAPAASGAPVIEVRKLCAGARAEEASSGASITDIIPA